MNIIKAINTVLRTTRCEYCGFLAYDHSRLRQHITKARKNGKGHKVKRNWIVAGDMK